MLFDSHKPGDRYTDREQKADALGQTQACPGSQSADSGDTLTHHLYTDHSPHLHPALTPPRTPYFPSGRGTLSVCKSNMPFQLLPTMTMQVPEDRWAPDKQSLSLLTREGQVREVKGHPSEPE